MSFNDEKLKWLIATFIGIMISATSVLSAQPVLTEDKAADVNGAVISMDTLNNEYSQTLKQKGISESDIPENQIIELKKEILESLINKELLLQECKKRSIVAEETDVSNSMASVKAQFETQDAYLTALKDADMKEEDLVSRVRQTLAINTMIDKQVTPSLSVTDEETKEYYDTHPESFQQTEKVRASHILVKVEQDAGESKKVTAKEKIKTIQRRLTEGEVFADLATETSDCPSSANGGDLGYFERGKMVQEFEDAAFALNPGEVSDIVQSQFGFHLIKVVDRKEAGVIAFENVKDDLHSFILKQKTSQAVTEMIESLRKNAEIGNYL